MRNFWLVAKHEYLTTVVRRAFLLMTIAIPVGMVALIALIILVESMGADDRPIGYVDYSGKLDLALYDNLPDADERTPLRSFPDEDLALAALEGEQIQALFVIPSGYPQTLGTDLYYLEDPPGGDAWGDFDDFVRISLLSEMPEDMQELLLEGPDITVYDLASNREFSERSIVNVVLPFVATFFFIFATMSGAGYMLGVVAGEKENRTIEVMVTSVTPVQLIGGKAAGLLAASLTQLAIYIVAAVVGLIVAAQYVPEIQQLEVPWLYLTIMGLFFLPTYALISAVMIAIGSAVTELQQGQQLAGLLNLVFLLPLLLLPLLFQDPGGPLMVFFTIFPTTSFMTIALRWGLGTVPLWQVGIGWVLLLGTTTFFVWAAARVFRVGMLRYGQPLSFRSVWAAVRGSG
ncbi:MAG: ABC transporter permease [Anaerolineae bacterium]|jgi:ABC-2 type transport system permease protein